MTTLRDRAPVQAPFPYREFRSPASALQLFDRLGLFPKILYYRAMRLHAASLARAAIGIRPRVVEVQLPWLATVRRCLPPSVKVVLAMHNVETVWQDALIRRRALPGTFRRMLRRMEAEAVALADHVLCLTPQDRDHIVETYGRSDDTVTAIPPGADFDPVSAAPSPGARPPRAVFVGSAFSENHAAARRLLELVVPRLDPGTEVLIVGDVCHSLRGARIPSSVRLLGRVDDLPSLLRTCDVLLNPSAMRTGIHMKIIEALAAGCRVISTPDGARGYEALVGGPVIVAELSDFARHTRSAGRLSPAEMERVRALSWPAIAQRRFDLYSRIGACL